MQKDLDLILLQNRESLSRTASADIENKYDDISIGLILLEIREEALRLKDIETAIDSKPVPLETSRPMDSKYVGLARCIDARLKRNAFYFEKLRPALVRRAKKLLRQTRIPAKTLMQYHCAEFVDACYANILGRHTDEIAKANACEALRVGALSKVGLLVQVLRSEEAYVRAVKVTGLGKYIWRERLKKGLLRIPILGRFVRWCVAVALLVKRMDQLFAVTSRLCEVQDAHEMRLVQLAGRMDSLQNEVVKLSSIDDLTAELEQHRNQHLAQDETLRELKIAYEQKKWETDLKEEKTAAFKERINRLYVRYEDALLGPNEHYVDSHAEFFSRFESWAEGQEKTDVSVLDLGCGVGGWILHLAEQGYHCTGVDSNPYMLELARGKNDSLKFFCEDSLVFLRSQQPESWDVISSFHMIEHLELEQLFELFDLCKRALRPGGLLILATPNPKNVLTATEWFHMDPTHKKIIPMELLRFYMNEWGLEVMDIVSHFPMTYFPMKYQADDPTSQMAFRFNMETEYSIWAVKPQ